MIDPSDFAKGINQHGYAFQHRVVHEIVQLFKNQGTTWQVAGVEVPTQSGDRTSRADILLVDDSVTDRCRFMVVECKRVNPKFGAWCFARAPYAFPGWLHRQVCGEFVTRVQPGHSRFETGGFGMTGTSRIYDVAFTLKSNGDGDSSPVANDKDALELACGQAVRGMNGIVNVVFGDSRFVRKYTEVNEFWFLPVVVTTSRLYTSNVDFTSVPIESGDVVVGEVDEVDWLVYQYPTSPHLKHEINRGSLADDGFSHIIARDFVRSVAIVSPAGIAGFLAAELLDHFDDDRLVE